MRNVLISVLFVLILQSCRENDIASTNITDNTNETNISYEDSYSFASNLKEKVSALKAYTSENRKFNQEVAFLIDMRISSGKKRFFVYDLKGDSILDKGLVSHGTGSNSRRGELKFSNKEGSGSTSLGMYWVGNDYVGQFGKAYKLHGLNSSNSNAYVRNVVLHKYHAVPDEVQNEPICLSYGCPMVSEAFFAILERIIDRSSKNILLYIYY
jgi:hypothetical protein